MEQDGRPSELVKPTGQIQNVPTNAQRVTASLIKTRLIRQPNLGPASGPGRQPSGLTAGYAA